MVAVTQGIALAQREPVGGLAQLSVVGPVAAQFQGDPRDPQQRSGIDSVAREETVAFRTKFRFDLGSVIAKRLQRQPDLAGRACVQAADSLHSHLALASRGGDAQHGADVGADRPANPLKLDPETGGLSGGRRGED